MKHRKIFAILLALALLCALTAPALAAGTTYEDFLADFDRWWAEKNLDITWEQFAEGHYVSNPDDLMRYTLYEQWKSEMWRRDYLAAHPEAWEELRANAYNYYEYDGRSAQDFMVLHNMTEEQFRDFMAEAQLAKLYYSYKQDCFLTEHGGVPGQLNVMVNGTCLTFPAERPAYVENGVTYVDAQTLSQALGADVAAGENGCAPLRAAAEALGCDVFWDSAYGMAVVLDPAAVAAEIDKDFTLYNRIYSNGYDGNWTLTGKAKAGLTIFDTMSGNKTAAGSGSAGLVISRDGLSGTIQYDLTAVLKLLREILPQLAGLPEKDTVELQMDTRGGLWFRAPALIESLAGNGMQITPDGWLFSPVDVRALEFFPQNKTMGEQLYTLAVDFPTFAASAYDNLQQMVQQEAELIGDAQFTRKGNAYTLTPELHTGFSPISDLYGLRVSRRDQTITVKDNNDVDIDTSMRLTWDESDFSLGEVAEYTCKSTRRGNKLEVVIGLHAKNLFELTLTLDLTATVTDQAPELTPPEGAQLLPLEELYNLAAS